MGERSLGDEFQLSFVLPTKSLQRVVTSINGKMTQLILCTKQNTFTTKQFNDDNFKNLTVASKDIVKVLKILSESVKESIQTKFKNDVAAVQEIEEATQNLIISAENLHLCSQMLYSMSKSRSFREAEVNQSCDLVSSVSKVFQNLTILLICMDNAETRSIVKLCRQTHQCVANLITTKSLKSFMEKFDVFGVIAEEFYDNVNRRCIDLLDSGTKGKMSNYLSQFKHSISMLVTSFTIAIKYPQNREAESSKDFAYNQISKAIHELINIIQTRQLSDDLSIEHGGTKIGVYPQLTSSIERILSVGRRKDIDDLEVLTKIQSLVQNYITLITVVKKNNLPVHGMVQHTIEDVKDLTKQGDDLSELICVQKNVKKMQRKQQRQRAITDEDETDGDLAEMCRSIRAQLKQLFRNAKHLVTSLFAQTFVVTSEPLQALLQASAEHGDTESAVDLFQRHTDEVLVACKLVANCCETPDAYQEMDCCIKHLKALTSQVVLMASDDEEDGGGNVQEGWRDVFNDLFVLCASCLDLRTLVSFILKELIKDFETVHVDIVNLSESSLSKNVITATGRSKLLTEIGRNEMKRIADMSVRNTILPLIKDTEQATLLTVANSNHLLEDIAQMSAQEDFISSTLRLKDSAKKFCRALLHCTSTANNSHNHSSVVVDSPQPGIRDFNDAALVVGLVQEMSNLQNKLSTVGVAEPPVTYSLDFTSQQPQLDDDTLDEADKIDMLMGTSGEHVAMGSTSGSDPMTSLGRAKEPSSDFVGSILDAFNNGCDEEVDSIVKRMTVVTNLVRDLNYDLAEMSKTNKFHNHDVEKLTNELIESVDLLKVALDLPPAPSGGGYNLSDEIGKHASKWEEKCKKVVKKLKKHFSAAPIVTLVREDDVINVNVLTSLVGDVMTLVRRRRQYDDDDEVWSDESGGDVEEVRGEETLTKLLSEFTDVHKKIEKLENSDEEYETKSRELAVLGYLHLSKFNRIKLTIDDVIETSLKGRAVKFPPHEVLLSTRKGKTGNKLFLYNLRLATVSQWIGDVIRTSLEHMDVCGAKVNVCVSKIKKAHIRCDVTKKGIEETIKLILRLEDAEKMGRNSRVCARFEYLHQRFMLEVARLYLFAKSLSTLKTANDTTTQQFERSGNYELNSTALFDSTKDFIKPSTMTSSDPNHHQSRDGAKKRTMEDELVYLLTDADVLQLNQFEATTTNRS